MSIIEHPSLWPPLRWSPLRGVFIIWSTIIAAGKDSCANLDSISIIGALQHCGQETHEEHDLGHQWRWSSLTQSFMENVRFAIEHRWLQWIRISRESVQDWKRASWMRQSPEINIMNLKFIQTSNFSSATSIQSKVNAFNRTVDTHLNRSAKGIPFKGKKSTY